MTNTTTNKQQSDVLGNFMERMRKRQEIQELTEKPNNVDSSLLSSSNNEKEEKQNTTDISKKKQTDAAVRTRNKHRPKNPIVRTQTSNNPTKKVTSSVKKYNEQVHTDKIQADNIINFSDLPRTHNSNNTTQSIRNKEKSEKLLRN